MFAPGMDIQIIEFADDTTVVGLITNTARQPIREVRELTVWYKDNNLFLNVIKTKEMIVDYRKRRTEHAPILIDRRLKIFGMGPQILKRF